jgi:hypothetical protein
MAMTPPRRPRGEKPATTIRFQTRQIAELQRTIAALRLACDDKDKVIAGFDVQMSEQDDQIKSLQSRSADRAIMLGEANKKLNQSAERLAFLEGYFYAKEGATLPTSRASLPSHTAETHPRPGSRDQEGVQVRRQDPAGARDYQTASERHGAAPGDEVRGFSRDDQAHPKRDKVEYTTLRRRNLVDRDWSPF